MENLKNKSGKIVKLRTQENLNFSEVEKIADKFGLKISDHQGDFLTLTNAKNEGLIVANVSEPSSYNNWSLYAKKSNTISDETFVLSQSVFEFLKSK